jgi:elongation of very long chain fatty acids protein 4
MEFLNALENGVRGVLPASWNQKINLALSAGNPLVKDFPLMNPFHVILISAAYLLCIRVGKMIMQNRKPLELKTFSILHNTFLIVLSLYMTAESIRQAWLNGFSLFCNGVSTTAAGLPLARVLWIFYASKIVEFIDTMIMIAKKNEHQLTFLHMYHHVTIFMIWWAVVYYAPGGDSYFSAAQNSFVHVLMYSYYLLRGLGVDLDKYKKYVTQLQMFQFLVNIFQASYHMVASCDYPRFLAYLLFFYMITLLALFLNFYRKGLQRKRDPKKDAVKKAE